MKLSAGASGRENNFNLLRLIASLAVVVSHCFVLFSGDPSSEPWVRHIGMTPGSIAVDVFFVTSGFLVTASLIKSQSAPDFLIGRLFRIFPGLWVMTLISVFLIGLHFTVMPASQYLRDEQTQTFLVKDLTVIWGITGTLPGVFNELPYKAGVNGSLWTLPWEVRMYAGLLMIWLATRVVSRIRSMANARILLAAVVLVTAFSAGKHFSNWFFHDEIDERFRLAYMFFSGALYQLLKDRVHLHPWTAALAMATVFATVTQGKLFFIAYHLLVPYAVLCLACLPKGRILEFNRLGDYSYGLYIYAFPIQQSILALAPTIEFAHFVAASTAAAGLAAIASWHWIEQPSIAAGGRLRGRLRSRLGAGRRQLAKVD